jgi:predicted  nucleic acid-binding Zn-ribbon protein
MRRKYEKFIRAVENKIEKLEHYISKLRKGISTFKEAITRTGSRIIKIGKQITENFSSKEEYNALESDKSTLSREIETEEGYESSTKESIGVIRADINTEEDAHEKFRDGVISESRHTKLTKDIGDRKSINQELRGEISSLERKIAKNTESDNIYSPQPSGMRM